MKRLYDDGSLLHIRDSAERGGMILWEPRNAAPESGELSAR